MFIVAVVRKLSGKFNKSGPQKLALEKEVGRVKPSYSPTRWGTRLAASVIVFFFREALEGELMLTKNKQFIPDLMD